MRRDLKKAEVEEKWRENANNREQWENITKVAYSGVTNGQPGPYKSETRR